MLASNDLFVQSAASARCKFNQVVLPITAAVFGCRSQISDARDIGESLGASNSIERLVFVSPRLFASCYCYSVLYFHENSRDCSCFVIIPFY